MIQLRDRFTETSEMCEHSGLTEPPRLLYKPCMDFLLVVSTVAAALDANVIVIPSRGIQGLWFHVSTRHKARLHLFSRGAAVQQQNHYFVSRKQESSLKELDHTVRNTEVEF